MREVAAPWVVICSCVWSLGTQAVSQSSIVVACTYPGRLDRLQSISQTLDRCEKALTQFLDLKKSAFPRFYFVSSAALLDILANSTTPIGVMPHLSACFDALSNLNLEASEASKKRLAGECVYGCVCGFGGSGVPPLCELKRFGVAVAVAEATSSTGERKRPVVDTATALVARDGEAILLDTPLILTGSVESWLNDVVGVMRKALRQQVCLTV